MRKTRAFMLILGLIASRSGATLLYRLTFDHTGAVGGEADAIYTSGPGDLLDPHQWVTRYGTNPVPQIAASDGPQGGGALVTAAQLAGSGQGPGYTSSTTNNKAYFVHGGHDRGLTLEAVFRATAWTANGWGGMVNYNNEHFLGFAWGTKDHPHIRFQVKSVGVITNIPAASLCDDAWHHVAGVWTRDADGANGRLEIFLDGVPAASRAVPIPGSAITIPTGGWGFSAEGYTTPPRLRSFIGKLDAAAVTDDVRGPGRFLLAGHDADALPDLYTEDFASGWSNGVAGFTGSGAAVPGRWALRDGELGKWQVMDTGAPQGLALAFTNGSHNSSWWQTGMQTPFRFPATGPVTAEFSARVRIACNAVSGKVWDARIHLMSRDQNGYGLAVKRSLYSASHGADNKVYTRIIKFRGSTAALGIGSTSNWTESEGADATGEVVVADAGETDFIRLHVRLSQETSGGPVT
ncbi:MAG: LamG-like jellyroll fold domain-containing protein, partial [Kiritimatiellia bacterium]|nr:LamG-like jellyroll fold domain-containing protein [Kiritimatiellia bacterium]